MKKFIIFFIFIPLVYSELHSFKTAYTAINEQSAGIPEFSAVTTLDDHQIDYYDSEIKKLIPKQNWMKKIVSTGLWAEYTESREKHHQIYKNNTRVLMQRFTQTHDGVHTYQRMCGCVWDEETGESQGFDRYAYDGEDFISLDLKENKYITPVAQAKPTVKKWNNDRAQLISLKQYYDYKCVYWLKEFLHLSKATEPKVSLLKKSPEYYTCHVTGFLFRNTRIFWRKNGQAMNVSSNLTSGDTLPNEDGTFQRRVTLYVLRDKWKKNQFSCVVEHKSLTETIQKNMTVNKIKRNKPVSYASYIMILVPVIISVIALFGLFALIALWQHRENLKADNKKKTIYFKTKPSLDPASSQDSQDSLIFPPSNECSSPREAVTFSEIAF